MPFKVGINGFGRIGRQVMKVVSRGGFGDLFEIVAINDLAPPETLAYLLQYDSTYGHFPQQVSVDDGSIRLGETKIAVLAEADPARLPWADFGIDVVIEATGRFTAAADARKHLEAGARKVIVSAPSDGADATIVIGVNDAVYDPDSHHVISNASCTTNCVAPLARVLHDAFGVERGLMTTIHSLTNDQVILDQPHQDLRRARSAGSNLIPTKTGAATAIGLVMPELDGKFDGFAVRVPTESVSLVDLVVQTQRPASVDTVNAAFLAASEGEVFTGILGFSRDPLVSSDYRGDSRSAIVDSLSTMVSGDRLVKVVAWYDNEWAYSCRIVDLTAFICEAGIPGTA